MVPPELLPQVADAVRPSKPYIVSIGGTGCSGNDTVGSGGGYYLDQYVPASKAQVIDVSLSYVVYTNTSKPTCFADDYVNSPEPQYLDAILADLESKYCIDRGKVFIHGHSSGAWEALTLGCARADVLRGVATQVGGGLRLHRPPCQKTPVATIYVEGLQDTDNPIGPLAPTDAKAIDLDSLGSAPARDDLLMRNGCVGNATKHWDAAYPACVQYIGCPASAPVVWCAIHSTHNIGANPTLRDQYAYNAIWKFWTGAAIATKKRPPRAKRSGLVSTDSSSGRLRLPERAWRAREPCEGSRLDYQFSAILWFAIVSRARTMPEWSSLRAAVRGAGS